MPPHGQSQDLALLRGTKSSLLGWGQSMCSSVKTFPALNLIFANTVPYTIPVWACLKIQNQASQTRPLWTPRLLREALGGSRGRRMALRGGGGGSPVLCLPQSKTDSCCPWGSPGVSYPSCTSLAGAAAGQEVPHENLALEIVIEHHKCGNF